ncbi:MAG: hypothetical protein K0R85_2722, partial [Devosia sp.]|nr:hypothetical protein [Devosia sp.]
MADDTDPKTGTTPPADPGTKDSKPAETRTGPVKPPVLDLKARP